MLGNDRDENPYAPPSGVPKPDIPAEDLRRYWRDFQPDFETGISTSGQPTAADEAHAAEILRDAGRRVTGHRGAIVLLLMFFGGLMALFYARETLGEELESSNVSQWLLIILASLVGGLISMRVALKKLVGPHQPRNFLLEPVELIVAPTGFYQVLSFGFSFLSWQELRYCEAPAMLIIEHPKTGYRRVIPRRFCASEAHWQELLAAVRDAIRAQSGSAPATTSQIRQSEPASHEPAPDLRAGWREFQPAGGASIVGSGTFRCEDAASFAKMRLPKLSFFRWGELILTSFVCGGALAVLGHFTASTPWLSATLFGAAAGAILGVLALALRLLYEAATLEQKSGRFADMLASRTITIFENCLTSHSHDGMSVWLWSELSLQRATDHLAILTIGKTNLAMPLPRHFFSAADWQLLQNRLATMPRDSSV